jgi:hypothetical protein
MHHMDAAATQPSITSTAAAAASLQESLARCVMGCMGAVRIVLQAIEMTADGQEASEHISQLLLSPCLYRCLTATAALYGLGVWADSQAIGSSSLLQQ